MGVDNGDYLARAAPVNAILVLIVGIILIVAVGLVIEGRRK